MSRFFLSHLQRARRLRLHSSMFLFDFCRRCHLPQYTIIFSLAINNSSLGFSVFYVLSLLIENLLQFFLVLVLNTSSLVYSILVLRCHQMNAQISLCDVVLSANVSVCHETRADYNWEICSQWDKNQFSLHNGLCRFRLSSLVAAHLNDDVSIRISILAFSNRWNNKKKKMKPSEREKEKTNVHKIGAIEVFK